MKGQCRTALSLSVSNSHTHSNDIRMSLFLEDNAFEGTLMCDVSHAELFTSCELLWWREGNSRLQTGDYDVSWHRSSTRTSAT